MELEKLYKEILKFLEVGDKIYFYDEKRGFEIKARDERYLICTKPAFGKAIYTILDSEELINSTNNYVFNPYNYLDQGNINQSLIDLENGEYELSLRHQANIIKVIDRFKKNGDKRIISFTEEGSKVLCINDKLIQNTLEDAYNEFKKKVNKTK